MKVLLIVLLLLSASVIISCTKLDIEKGTPQCVENKIKDFNKSSSCDNANVNEYTFQGSTVYTLEPGTCGADMPTEVINSVCTRLGVLGGFAGNTKINGEEFSNATFVKSIWTK